MKALIRYQRLVDKLPVAVKSGLLVGILIIVYVFWHYSVWQGLRFSILAKSEEISTLKQSILDLEERFKAIKKNIELSTHEFSSETSKMQLVDSKQSIKMLHDLFKVSNKLVLLHLESKPVKDVKLPGSDIKIFEHGVEIVFMGDYFSTMHYLKSIEKLQWKIFLDKLEYQVLEYPSARVTLNLHTINDNSN